MAVYKSIEFVSLKGSQSKHLALLSFDYMQDKPEHSTTKSDWRNAPDVANALYIVISQNLPRGDPQTVRQLKEK